VTLEAFLREAVPHVSPAVAQAALSLLADGATPAFVAGYRKARTGGLGEHDVRAIADAKARYDALKERQRFVCDEAARQGVLTPALRERIETTFDRDALDDLYLPYKRRRRTPAAAAAEAELAPLADWIWNCGHGLDTPLPGQTLELWAFTFRSEEHGIADAAAAIAGAEDILVERLAETASLRARVRAALHDGAWLHTARGERAKAGGRFDAYFDAAVAVAELRDPANAHRYLEIRRGVNEGELRARLAGPPGDDAFVDRLRASVVAEACSVPDAPGAAVLVRAAERAFDEHVWPMAEVATHKTIRMVADEIAIAEIETEARRLLLAPPFGPAVVLAIDPAPRGGSKVAVVTAEGRPLEHGTLHIEGDDKRARATELVCGLAERHGVQAVAVGDGLASKEVARFVRAVLRERGVLVPVVVVSEVGARAWAASEAARAEHPDLDQGARAAVTIARRLQDPLAELARLEPRLLAVGPHVHDISLPRLEAALEAVVVACIAEVGVDVNAAPEPLLARVPGVGPGLAHALVEHRAEHGPFAALGALRGVALLDVRAFEQAAGFLRVAGGTQPLDASAVHPERYDALARAAAALGCGVGELCGEGARAVAEAPGLAGELDAGTLADVVAMLGRAGRDPRGRLAPLEFHPSVRTLADLTPGLACPGVVTSVTTFGAFVDVGLPHDGLVHVSRLADEFVKDPHAVVRVGDTVTVRVVDVNREKQQFALSMRREPPARPAPPRARDTGPRPARDAGPRRGPEPRGRPREPQKPAFNNPFADLATQLRSGGKSSGPSKPPSS
jgi:uncharacterized protein